MFSFFNRLKSGNDNSKNNRSNIVLQLPELDSTLYPIHWENQTYNSPDELLTDTVCSKLCESSYNSTNCQSNQAINSNNVASSPSPIIKAPTQQEFSNILSTNSIYQEWINFTVFGRYVQRSFSAFYRQTEDIFNADMPELLRHELMRHTQHLPLGQTLFFGGQIPTTTRLEKLLITTLSPATAIAQALENSQNTSSKPIVLNHIICKSNAIKAFAVKHNKYTSHRLLHEVMVLDFNILRLIKELPVCATNKQPIIRYYELR